MIKSTRSVPNEYKKVFEEYVLIRLLDDLTEDNYQVLKKQTTKSSFLDIIPIILPNFGKKYNEYLTDFLNEVYGN